VLEIGDIYEKDLGRTSCSGNQTTNESRATGEKISTRQNEKKI